jgi:hypothetical protein
MAWRLPKPEIYVTWLSKLLVADRHCERSAWFKAHHQYKKLYTGDFDTVAANIKHTALLKKVRASLESEGRVVATESQNWFEVKGRVATLRGKPDLVALGDTPIVCDVKTGKKRASDVTQVMIYMWALPYAYPKYREITFEGLLVYPDLLRHVPTVSVDDAFKESLIELIGRIGSPIEARKVPSYAECRYCDIGKEHCAARVEEPEGSITTDVF